MITITSKATIRLSAKLRREMKAEIASIRAQLEQAQIDLDRAHFILEQLGYGPCVLCGTIRHTSTMSFFGHSDAGTDYSCHPPQHYSRSW